jgi:hypothetical protein
MDELITAFGPYAAIIAGMRDALRDAAEAIDACTICAGEGFPVCALCVVWEAERLQAQAFEQAQDVGVIG